MNSFETTLAAFVEAWVQSTDVVNKNQVISVEESLNVKLPKNYRTLLLTEGVLYSPNLLSATSEYSEKNETEIFGIQQFYRPQDITEETKAHENAGMPSGYFAFAHDFMSNLFLFSISECKETSTDSPVYFFDHDFMTIEKVHESLGEALAFFTSLKSG